MAESSTKAFGRYLKTLRERRGLSLDDVASLSQTFPEKINKGYLSRCENGHQKLAFSKVIALSRIFEVPADVLVERMELDLELDRVGGPETEGMSYAELHEAGKTALKKGRFIEAYAFLRDGIQKAGSDPVKKSFKDAAEQDAMARMSCGTAARALGRHRFALHEFLYLESTGAFGPKFYPIILERISNCHRSLGNLNAADRYADESISKAETYGDREFIGYVYYSKAHIMLLRSQFKAAAEMYQKAYQAHKEVGNLVDCALALNSLAQCYFDLGRYSGARRAAEASQKITKAQGRQRSQALSLVLLGEIDEIENRPLQAKKRWKEAVTIAKRIKDRELRFKAEFVLYRRALKERNHAVSRAICRRLTRLAPGMPADTHELNAFKQLLAEENIASS